MRRSCTSVLVGRAATRDGSILIARNEDNTTPAAPKSLRMVPAGERDGVELVSGANGFAITLPEGGLRYSAMPDVTPEEGLFEEAGRECCPCCDVGYRKRAGKRSRSGIRPLCGKWPCRRCYAHRCAALRENGTRRREAFGRNRGCAWLRRKQRRVVRRPSGSVVYGNRYGPSLGCSAHSRRLRCRGRESALDPGSRFRKRLIHVFGGNSRIRRGACA